MLSIQQMSGSGQGNYYLDLAREDYYVGGGEPPGQWHGKGAKALGLLGKVEREDFSNLLKGYSQDGEALVQNAGDENRQSGWDLTFSDPKTVSAAWSQAAPKQRKAFEKAHRNAVDKALDYLERKAGLTRRGKGGVEEEKVGLVIAKFDHSTSRAQDPQLHTHAILLNVGVRSDGSTGAIKTSEIYQRKMAAGALFRAELASQIEKNLELGFETVKDGKGNFEIKGVSKELCKEFSKRRSAIEEELERTGNSSAVAAKEATLKTRDSKDAIPREELFAKWHETGRQLKFSKDELESLRKQVKIGRETDVEKQKAFDNAVKKLTDHQSAFTKTDLVRRVAEEAQGRGLGVDEVFNSIDENLESSSEIVSLGRHEGKDLYTTREMLALEKELIGNVEQSKFCIGHSVKDRSLDAAFAAKVGISDEQKNAARHVSQGSGGIRAVTGMAGTGKSYMLEAVKDAHEAEGYQVIGAALAGKAAQGLQDDTGIKSDTLHKTLGEIERGNLELGYKSVVIVDEAGMVGTRQMNQLVAATQSAGAKLVLVGDARQLQPIEAGGAFKAITKSVGQAKLTEIRRQEEDWMKQAVHDFADGNAKKALKAYAERGQLSVLETRSEAKDALIKDWKDQGGVSRPKDHLMIVGTNLDAHDLNERAQIARYSKGELGSNRTKIGNNTLFEKDRVLFTKNSRSQEVRNGQLGTVEGINNKSSKLIVRLDNGNLKQVDTKEYQDIKPGYAVTAHKAQGMTAENAYILAGGGMQDRELTYVQASRAKKQTQIYTDKAEAGENLTEIARQMCKSREKRLALDFLQPMSKARCHDKSKPSPKSEIDTRAGNLTAMSDVDIALWMQDRYQGCVGESYSS